MKVTVISASPKGEASITYHSVLWIQKNNPSDSFSAFHAGKSKACWEDAYKSMTEADVVLFCYPVYTFLAPARLHEFMAYVKERGGLEGKAYAQVTTSKHFYDTTAHAWLNENCADLGMKSLGGLSADMDDLLCERGRKEALDFWKLACWRLNGNGEGADAAGSPRRSTPRDDAKVRLMSSSDPIPERPEVEDKIVVVASLCEGDDELRAMIEAFAAASTLPVELFNVETYPFKGSCVSCFNCASTGKCIYADNFDSYLRGRILNSRAIVYAYRIKDHSMGVKMKVYDDRQFCNGHRTVTMGMPIGYIVAGDISRENNLRLLMDARADVGGNFMAGVATDGASVRVLAQTVDLALRERLEQPRSFLGTGGMRIFRDLIWMMQGLMRADHKFFKSHGQYDFPQKRCGDMLKMYLVGWLMNSPTLKKKAGKQIADGIISPYRKAIGE